MYEDRIYPDSKVHVANMGPTWVLSAPDGPHVGHMNLAIRDTLGLQQDILDSITLKSQIFYTNPSIALSRNHAHYSSLVVSWWRHQMETFSPLLALCVGKSPVTGEFPAQRPVMQSFDVFFDLHLNIRLSKQSWGWWFETPSCSLWRHCNVKFCCVLVPV